MLRSINNFSLEGHTGTVWCVSWSHSGKTLASCGEDRMIRLWNKKDEAWHCSKIIETSHDKTIRSIKWSPCDKFIASCGFDGKIIIWQREDESSTILDGHGSEVKSIDWSHNGLYLASCCRDKTVWIWERVTDEDYQCLTTLNYHSQDVKRVKWLPSSEDLFSVSYDNCVKSYSHSSVVDDWDCNFSSALHSSTVWSIDFNADGKQMATCSADKTIRIWCKKEGEKEAKWHCSQCISGHHDLPIYDLSWCKKTDNIATACGDNAIRIFQKNEEDSSYELQCSLPDAHLQDVNCVSWNPCIDGLLASCSDDGFIKLWFFTTES